MTSGSIRGTVATLAAGLAFLGAPTAHAQSGAGNLSEGQPIDIEDALPTEAGQVQLQGTVRYERTSDEEDRVTLEPGLQAGLGGNWEAAFSAPFITGVSDRSGSGDVRLGVLRQLVAERGALPALAVSLRATLPTGENSEGVDTRLRLIATRTLQQNAPERPRLHLNLAWKRNDKKQPGEWGDGYEVRLGYSRELRPDETVLVAELSREQEPTESQTENVVSLGLIRQVSEQAQLSFAAGAGLGGDSPRVRLTAGFQIQF